MGCVDVVGPRGGPGDREHHKQQDGGGSGGRMFSLRNVWTNFCFSFMTVAKGHLWTAFLDFLNKYSKDSV